MVKNVPASAGAIKRVGLDSWVGKIPWRMPWTEESGGLQSVGSQRVRTQLK